MSTDRTRQVAELRRRTEASISVCLEALAAASGDVDAAEEWIRDRPDLTETPPDRPRSEPPSRGWERPAPRESDRTFCPECGGEWLRETRDGRLECVTPVRTLITHPPNLNLPPGPARHPVSEWAMLPHRYAFTVGDGLGASWAATICFCGSQLAGRCSSCGAPLCETHGGLSERSVCSRCRPPRPVSPNPAPRISLKASPGTFLSSHVLQAWARVEWLAAELVDSGCPGAEQYWDSKDFEYRRLLGSRYIGKPRWTGWQVGSATVFRWDRDAWMENGLADLVITRDADVVVLTGEVLKGRRGGQAVSLQALLEAAIDPRRRSQGARGAPRQNGTPIVDVDTVVANFESLARRHGISLDS